MAGRARRRFSAASRPSSASRTCRAPRTWPTPSASPSPASPASPASLHGRGPSDDPAGIHEHGGVRGPFRGPPPTNEHMAGGVRGPFRGPPPTNEHMAGGVRGPFRGPPPNHERMAGGVRGPFRGPRYQMIALLRGRLRRKHEDRVVVEAAGVGYEVVLPPVVQQAIAGALASDGDGAAEVTLEIHYHATQNQPSPVLIGFLSGLDKEFFEKLITVKDVGPLVAARSLAAPVAEIAAAIARQDEAYLRRLPGIGPQKAKNIVAQLSTKVAKFALSQPEAVVEGKPAVAAPAHMDEDGLRSSVF